MTQCVDRGVITRSSWSSTYEGSKQGVNKWEGISVILPVCLKWSTGLYFCGWGHLVEGWSPLWSSRTGAGHLMWNREHSVGDWEHNYSSLGSLGVRRHDPACSQVWQLKCMDGGAERWSLLGEKLRLRAQSRLPESLWEFCSSGITSFHSTLVIGKPLKYIRAPIWVVQRIKMFC